MKISKTWTIFRFVLLAICMQLLFSMTPMLAAVPIITDLDPDCGVPAGGTFVTITGMFFTGVTDVQFDGASVLFSFVDDTTITVPAAPAGVLGNTVPVTVTTPDGTSVAANYTYKNAPTLITVFPLIGTTGSTVTLTGTGFSDATLVRFGVVTTTNFMNTGDTIINVIAPVVNVNCAGPAVQVLACGAFSNPMAFIYADPPVITSVTPPSATVGTSITIGGQHFNNVGTVLFGATNAPGFMVPDEFTIIVDAPAGADCGVLDVRVVTLCAGILVSAITPLDEFTFIYPAPTVTGLIPPTGPSAGLTAVTISGNDFHAPSTVNFGTESASPVSVVNQGTISTVSPQAAANSTCEVEVIVSSCELSSSPVAPGADLFTYIFPPPTVTGIDPTAGPIGTSVIITGTEFHASIVNPSPIIVTFGGIPATSVTLDSPTQITAVAPPGIPCDTTVDVVVDTCGQVVLAGQFTYTCTPLPPSDFIGCILKDYFISGEKCFALVATWTASPSINVVSYRIYQGNNIIATVPASDPLPIEIAVSDCIPNYSIAAVNNSGLESVHVPIQIVN